jgi:trehalose 6-phosphate phosphatase
VDLPEPTTEDGRAGLAAMLAGPRAAVVAVDFDGTLAPIVTRPEDARPVDGAADILTRLSGLVAVVAVVTGRAAPDAVALGGLDVVPGLRVLGHYGLEEWRDGQLRSPEPLPAIEVARERLRELLATAPDGVHVEDKEQSLVVHTRPAADPAAALAALTEPLQRLAAELDLELAPGRMVLELRPGGVDKGSAVRRLVDRETTSAVIYVGDDLGDLAAFDAVVECRTVGVAGVTVASVDPAVPDAPAELAAAADLVVGGPAAVVAFLGALADAITGQD